MPRFAEGRMVSVALAATALAPTLVVSAPAATVFTSEAPELAEVTSTWKVHEPFAGTVPPVRVTLPAFEVTVPPAHVVPAFGVAAVVMPPGYVSVTEVTVIGPPFGLPTVIVSVEIAFGSMVAGTKALATVGAVAVTVRVAVFDTAPAAVWLLVTPDAVLLLVPAAVARTTTVTVQASDAGTESPVNESAVWPATKLLPPAPAQVPPALPAASITMPESASVKDAPVSAIGFGLVMVKVMVLVPPSETVAGEKPLEIDAATATESDADAV